MYFFGSIRSLDRNFGLPVKGFDQTVIKINNFPDSSMRILLKEKMKSSGFQIMTS
jgi:hypothetical protein